MKRLFFLLFFVVTTTSLSAQVQFEPNYVLVARKAGKKTPGLFTNGEIIKVHLNTGAKIKGQLLIYTDYIDIDGEQIYMEDIVAIKRPSNAFYTSMLSSMAFSELLGTGFINQGTENLGLRTGLQVTLSALTVTTVEKRHKKGKGWTYELVDTAPLRDQRRNR